MAKSTAIEVRPPNFQTIEIPIEGREDFGLITHRMSDKAIKEMRDKQTKQAKGPQKAKDPEGDYESSRYTLPDGRDGFPSLAFKAAAIRACKTTKINMTDARQMFNVQSDGISDRGQGLVAIEGKPLMREDVVRLQGNKADLRYRAEYKGWKTTLTVEFDADQMSAQQIVNLFARAGVGVGVGDWRPEKNGPFGRFSIAGDAS